MSKRLFVGNLPFSLTLDELKKTFSSFGDIEDATIVTNKFSGRSKGFGFITFKNDDDAQKAIKEMNGKELAGRAVIINEARPMTDEKPRRNFNRKRFGDNNDDSESDM